MWTAKTCLISHICCHLMIYVAIYLMTKSYLSSNDPIYVHSTHKKKNLSYIHELNHVTKKLFVDQKFASTLVILVITENKPKSNGYYRNRTVYVYKTI